MLRELVDHCSGAVFTSVAEPARALARHARVALEPALRPAGRDRARSRTPRCAWRRSWRGRMEPSWRPDRSTSWPTCCPPRAAPEVGAVNERGPGVLQMVALVAVVVALVILVFFALGYGFGRMFL